MGLPCSLSLAHLTYEHPDEPETTSKNGQETIDQKLSETITLLLMDNSRHVTSLAHRELIIMSSHLSYEDPDQPKTEREQDHEAVPDKMEETVVSLLHNINNWHLPPIRKNKERSLIFIKSQ